MVTTLTYQSEYRTRLTGLLDLLLSSPLLWLMVQDIETPLYFQFGAERGE